MISGPARTAAAGQPSQVRLDVTGIVEPTDPASTFWSADPLLAGTLPESRRQGQLWEGAVIADPGESAVVQQIFGQQGLDIQWELPVDTAGLHGQAPALLQPAEPDHAARFPS